MEGGPVQTFVEMASLHTSGMKVLPLTSSPLTTDMLEPQRVAEAIAVARRGFDFVVVDLHPSYSPLNRAIFERSDRILVPVTPDVPGDAGRCPAARRRARPRACARSSC